MAKSFVPPGSAGAPPVGQPSLAPPRVTFRRRRGVVLTTGAAGVAGVVGAGLLASPAGAQGHAPGAGKPPRRKAPLGAGAAAVMLKNPAPPPPPAPELAGRQRAGVESARRHNGGQR
ncbi:MAG TPA: hypothetical protein VHN78_10615 [Chloroflexota bacterium]|nr:hypothetical protein [Chloroflexota bacterium]